VQYGWYLLDDVERGLIRSNVVRDVVPYGPFHVELQPVGVDGTPMDYYRFTEIVDELAAMNLRSVRLAGGGDPLAHPRIVDIIRYLAATGAAIAEVATDATRLDDDVARALLEVGAHTLVATIDDANTVALDNIRRLRDERNRRGWHLPKLAARFALRPETVERVGPMIVLARELEAGSCALDLDEPSFAGVTAREAAFMREQSAWVRNGDTEGFVSGALLEPGALERAAGLEAPVPLVQLGRGNGAAAPAPWEGDRHCYIPWYHATVDASFEVWPCRHLSGEDFRSLGNVRDEAVAAVWNGSRAREYRAEFTAAMLGQPVAGRYLDERCRTCRLRETLADDRFYDETEAWLKRQRVGMSAPTFPRGTSNDGFDLPALRAIRERFPRSRCAPGALETVERIHAEAEIARIEALRLRVQAAELEARATLLLRESGDPSEAEAGRVRAARLKRTVTELDDYAERLFEEAGRAGGVDLVAAAPPPFESMCDWLRRLHEVDPSISPDVDHTYVIWMSLFKTLADNADMSGIHRVMGVGVGFEGPEVNYNDHFAEHYCLDIYDYTEQNPKLKFITADIQKGVDFPDATFDLIYSHSVFEHLKDVPRALAEIDRLVALGKYVYITVSPLYYSPTGAHVNHPVRLAHWEHLSPASEYYLLDSPDPKRIDEGVFLNKMTVSDFLAAVGRVGWEVRHFSVRIVHPRSVPAELKAAYPLVDLVVEEYRFVGRKVIPKSEGVEW
jgi:MoaA/NifB/PqqE/SkfB family radical SAM enzyme/SAM-dependent methyltransferase